MQLFYADTENIDPRLKISFAKDIGKIAGIKQPLTLMSAAENKLRISGHYGLEHFPQLKKISRKTMLQLDLKFSLNAQNLPYLVGSIKTKLVIECQRCLADMPFLIDQTMQLLFSKYTTANNNTKQSQFEVIELTKSILNIDELISAEVLLTLPISPKHSHQCLQYQHLAEQKITNKPFQILKTLKQSI